MKITNDGKDKFLYTVLRNDQTDTDPLIQRWGFGKGNDDYNKKSVNFRIKSPNMTPEEHKIWEQGMAAGESEAWADWSFAMTEIAGFPDDFDVTPTKVSEVIKEALSLLREVRQDGIMEDWGDDLPKRIDAFLGKLNEPSGT